MVLVKATITSNVHKHFRLSVPTLQATEPFATSLPRGTNCPRQDANKVFAFRKALHPCKSLSAYPTLDTHMPRVHICAQQSFPTPSNVVLGNPAVLTNGNQTFTPQFANEPVFFGARSNVSTLMSFAKASRGLGYGSSLAGYGTTTCVWRRV